MKQPIAITLGDPAGIGPEIIAKAFRDAPHEMHGCFVVGDVATMRRASELISRGSIRLPVASIDAPAEALMAPPQCLPVLQIGPLALPVALGQISAVAGKLAAECVVWAAKAALRANGADAIVAGVFGVPTFAIGNELYWGEDATGMLRDYLADPTLFDTPTMRRFDTLPVAAERRR